MKRKILVCCCFLLGLGIFLFTIVSNYFNNQVHYQVIEEYKENVKNLHDDEINQMKEKMRNYNESLTENVSEIDDPFNSHSGKKISEYDTIVNIGQAIAYLEVPKLDLELPIYQGVNDTVLAKGIGHLPNTSLPLGGKGTHASLTAHRGLPTATLFRHLDKLDYGDEFHVHTLDETLSYK